MWRGCWYRLLCFCWSDRLPDTQGFAALRTTPRCLADIHRSHGLHRPADEKCSSPHWPQPAHTHTHTHTHTDRQPVIATRPQPIKLNWRPLNYCDFVNVGSKRKMDPTDTAVVQPFSFWILMANGPLLCASSRHCSSPCAGWFGPAQETSWSSHWPSTRRAAGWLLSPPRGGSALWTTWSWRRGRSEAWDDTRADSVNVLMNGWIKHLPGVLLHIYHYLWFRSSCGTV